MIKSEAMNKFGYSSQDAFDTMLLDLNIDPDKTDFTDEECDRISQHIASTGATKALPTGEPDNAATNGHLTVTDDDILAVAANTGVDLDVVMNAAAHVADLEALVKWVEVYKEFEDEQAIRDSAREQFELDQLRKKESQLGERLTAALNKSPVNTNLIRERLGVVVPKTVTKLGKWDGKVDSENAPDFLKPAREAIAKAGIGQN
jgi:hypothetical protein